MVTQFQVHPLHPHVLSPTHSVPSTCTLTHPHPFSQNTSSLGLPEVSIYTAVWG